MKNNFTVFDETSNNRRRAQSILKFEINNKEYLIYIIDNGDDNTRIILLSNLYKQENRYSINDITEEEKNSLNQLVYNMMMSLPFQKDKDGNELINEFMNKNSVKISLRLPELSDEKYYTNSLIAKVNTETIEKVIDFYHIYLDEKENNIPINTWKIPSVEDVVPSLDNIQEVPQMPANNILETNEMQNINLFAENTVPQNVNIPVNNDSLVDQTQTNTEDYTNDNLPNPQAEMLSRMNNLNTNNNLSTQPNIMRPNEKGNVNTKYIVIGTVCIILALLVVAVAYIMINNIK